MRPASCARRSEFVSKPARVSGSRLYTDAAGGYRGLSGDYQHEVMDQAVEYVAGEKIAPGDALDENRDVVARRDPGRTGLAGVHHEGAPLETGEVEGSGQPRRAAADDQAVERRLPPYRVGASPLLAGAGVTAQMSSHGANGDCW